MSIQSENFSEASQSWDLERLYADLASAKKIWVPHARKGLSDTEKEHLRGLLCGYNPDQIAEKLHKNAAGVRSALTNTIYRYVETLTARPLNSLSSWQDVVNWLTDEYKIRPSYKAFQSPVKFSYHHYYTDISCPRRVWVKIPRISIVVRLRANHPEYTEVLQKLLINTELPVRVRVDAPAFYILNDIEQEISIQPDIDSSPLVFDLKPKPEYIGRTHINFDFFQAGNPIGDNVSISVEITSYEAYGDAEIEQTTPKQLSLNIEPPSLKLYIKYERFHNPPALYFTLFRGDSLGYDLPAITLEGDPKSYAATLYKKLQNLTELNSNSSRMIPVKNKLTSINTQELDRTIKNIGFKIWEELIPSELKTIYLENKENWRNQTLLLVSDEPYIPWELVWPYDETNNWEDDVPWCLGMRMTRWLRRNAEGKGHEVAPTQLYLKKLACIAPKDANLPYALEERNFLNRQIVRYKLDNVSPDYSSLSEVRRLLEKSEYNWLHIAAHGLFNENIPDDASAICLENGENLTLDDIIGAKIKGHINLKRPGFVFNACHSGRQAWALTGLGGWPNRLISSGAGLFVAPLWKVNDYLALKFAQTFYEELFNGKTVSEALHSSRLASKAAGDSTWLAYSAYAHPNAQIIYNNLKSNIK